MIIIVYTPPGEEPKTWEIETDSWTYGETVAIEQEYGGTCDDFFDDARDGSHTARRILLWMVRRRTEPELQLKDLDDLLVAYLSFLQTKPGADPKEQAAPDEAASETDQDSSPTGSESSPT